MNQEKHLSRLERQATGIGVACLAGVLASAWYFGLLPSRGAFRQLTDRQTQLERFIETETALRDEHQACLAELDGQRRINDSILARVPLEPKEADFLELLSAAAEKSGVEVQSFQPLSSQSVGHIGVSQIRISGRGEYLNLIQFLDVLRKMPRMNRVSRLELAAADAERRMCSIEVTLELFFNERSRQKSQLAG